MRLLVVTQTVDREDPALGFFHRWIEEFARQVDEVTVICLREGMHALPDNVRVLSLGKEHRVSSPVRYALRFLRLAWKVRLEHDAVFVHMNPEYLIIAGWLWRVRRMPVVLWYLHKQISWRLRLGIFFASVVCTASPASMRVETRKKRIVGHGIDTAFFSLAPAPEGPVTCISAGRVAPIKRTHVLVEAALRTGVRLRILGASLPSDRAYEDELRARARGGSVEFVGPQDQEGVRSALRGAHLFLHASDTGSIDKAPLEALASGVPVITTNQELQRYTLPALMPTEPTEDGFVRAIERALTERPWEDTRTRASAHEFVRTHFDLVTLIRTVLAELDKVAHGIAHGTVPPQV